MSPDSLSGPHCEAAVRDRSMRSMRGSRLTPGHIEYFGSPDFFCLVAIHQAGSLISPSDVYKRTMILFGILSSMHRCC